LGKELIFPVNGAHAIRGTEEGRTQGRKKGKIAQKRLTK